MPIAEGVRFSGSWNYLQRREFLPPQQGRNTMPFGTILLKRSWGYGPSGILRVILIVVLVLVLLGKV